MASEIKVNKISPESGTTLTLGDSGDTINFGSGVLPNFENLTVTGDLTVDTNSLKVDSTNNFVGIGTASPSVALDVVGAITATGNITGTLATAAQPNITSVGTLTSFASTGIDDNATSTAITIDSSDNVGIGTSSPTTKLDIVGTGVNGIELGQQSDNTGNSSRLFFNNSTNIWTTYSTAGSFKIASGATIGTSSGTDRLVIDSSGNVGIGTSSPSEILHIEGNSPYLVISNTGENVGGIKMYDSADSGGQYFHLFYDSASSNEVSFDTGASGEYTFNVNTAEKMRIDSSGNVLIGTTDAGYPVFGDNLTLESSTHSGITIRSGTTSQGNLYFSDATGTGTGTYAGAINYLHSVDAMVFRSDSTESMRIDSSGNVGIGTTSPSSYYANNLVVDIGSSAQSGITIVADSTNQAMFAFADGTSGDTRYRGFLDYNHSNDSLSFGSAGSERMRIDSSGNVGIGESAPLGKLHVKSADSGASADSNADELVIEGSGNSGISILSGTSSSGNIIFGDSGDNNVGRLEYNHGDNSIRLEAAGSQILRITSASEIGTGSSSGTLTLRGGDTYPGGEIKLAGGVAGSNPGTIIFSTDDGADTDPAERMLIDSNGTLFNGSSIISDNTNGAGEKFTGGGFIGIQNNTANSTASCFQASFGTPKVVKMQIKNDGDLENTNNSYGAISDVNLKENIVDASSQWDDIKALQVRNYNFKEETGIDTHTQIGLIAQEVELVSPGLVGESIDEETGESTKNVAYSVLYMKAVKALQEAMERIETLEAKVQILENNQP